MSEQTKRRVARACSIALAIILLLVPLSHWLFHLFADKAVMPVAGAVFHVEQLPSWYSTWNRAVWWGWFVLLVGWPLMVAVEFYRMDSFEAGRHWGLAIAPCAIVLWLALSPFYPPDPMDAIEEKFETAYAPLAKELSKLDPAELPLEERPAHFSGKGLLYWKQPHHINIASNWDQRGHIEYLPTGVANAPSKPSEIELIFFVDETWEREGFLANETQTTVIPRRRHNVAIYAIGWPAKNVLHIITFKGGEPPSRLISGPSGQFGPGAGNGAPVPDSAIENWLIRALRR